MAKPQASDPSLIALIHRTREIESSIECADCGEPVHPGRARLGYRVCLVCGEKSARTVKHTIVPMPKSNYVVVTDRALLIGLNSSHKGVK